MSTFSTGFYRFGHGFWSALTHGKYNIEWKLRYTKPISDPQVMEMLRIKMRTAGGNL